MSMSSRTSSLRFERCHSFSYGDALRDTAPALHVADTLENELWYRKVQRDRLFRTELLFLEAIPGLGTTKEAENDETYLPDDGRNQIL